MVTMSFAGPGLIQYDAVSLWQEGRTAVQMEVPVQWPRSGWRGSADVRKSSAAKARVVFIERELYAGDGSECEARVTPPEETRRVAELNPTGYRTSLLRRRFRPHIGTHDAEAGSGGRCNA